MEAWTTGQRIDTGKCEPDGTPIMLMEVGEPHSMPARLPDDVWAAMPKDEKTERMARMRDLHSENASIRGRSNAVWDVLSVSEELRDEPSLWFPCSMDFRHRIYPLACNGPHPQGDDLAKAVLMFAEGVPLGDDGLFWLCVRAANCYGQDKLTLEERVEWTLTNTQSIHEAASSPLKSVWWTQADEPWSFLATCFELTAALALSQPASFVSHLPCPMDGSCNGLQHLSAMGLDPVGACATNLTSARTRQDVYEEVAIVVRQLVAADVAAGLDAARVWDGKVTRRVVKRAVMTTPYGVTDRGIRDQLIADGHVPYDHVAEPASRGAAADYLRDKLVLALGQTVQSARSIMAWLQTSADRLAKAGLPMEWTTPAGSKVRQAYHTTTKLEIRTLLGRMVMWEEQRDAGLSARKQSLASAPNVIHSFDAAHLAMTVVSAARAGISSFAMIHDSYGSHAGLTTRLALILREEFVAIYRENWMERIYQELKAAAPHVDLPLPPERGAFNIEEVIDAPFFFS